MRSTFEDLYSPLVSATSCGRGRMRQIALGVMTLIATLAVTMVCAWSALARTGFSVSADISSASGSQGQLHITARFPDAGTYDALFAVGHPRPGQRTVTIHRVALGLRRVGTEHVSIRVSNLEPGPYTLFIELTPARPAKEAGKAGTWVYFVLQGTGAIEVGRIVTP